MTAFSDGFVLAQRRTKSADSYTAPSSMPVPPAVEMQGREGTNPTRRERDGERGQGLSNIGESSSLSHVSPLPQESASSTCVRIARLLVLPRQRRRLAASRIQDELV